MPWKPLSPEIKRIAARLSRKRGKMREDCFKHRRREILVHQKLGFFARLKFYMRTSK